MSEKTSPSPSRLASAGSLDELYALLKPMSTGPGWNKPTPSLWDEPRKTFVPIRWRYAQAKAALDSAGRLDQHRTCGTPQSDFLQSPSGE